MPPENEPPTNEPPKLDWNIPADKRRAAAEFLKAVSKPGDPESMKLRETAIQDRAAAKRIFQEIGGIAIPEDVEIICLTNDVLMLDKVVIFRLPDDHTEISNDNKVLNHWIAAWQPYNRDLLDDSNPTA